MDIQEVVWYEGLKVTVPDKNGHDYSPLNTRYSFKCIALHISGHRTEDTSQGPPIGQITYHLERIISKLTSQSLKHLIYNADYSKYC